MCDQTTNTTGQIKAGEVKAYAVTTPGAGGEPARPAHHGRGGPAGAPGQRLARPLRAGRARRTEIVQKLTEALKVALADQKVIDQMAKLGTAPVAEDDATPEAHTEQLEEQIELWGPIIEDAGVTPRTTIEPAGRPAAHRSQP